MSYAWTCPFCKRPTTITSSNEVSSFIQCLLDSTHGDVSLRVHYIVCPNTECNKLVLSATLYESKWNGNSRSVDKILNKWNLIPSSTAKVYSSEVVPKAIIEDYEEACKIVSLSPKSSATLARRALQGMIRNYWKVERPSEYKGRWSLVNEIKAIEDKVEADVWTAIDAVRDMGNIGAHMEQDVNVIIDVEPEEAQRLIELIEMLIEEWYINSHERRMRLAEIKQMADDKKTQKTTKSKVKK